MRTVIHLSEEEAESFFNNVDRAYEYATLKGGKPSDALKEYMSGPKGEEAICIRFVSGE